MIEGHSRPVHTFPQFHDTHHRGIPGIHDERQGFLFKSMHLPQEADMTRCPRFAFVVLLGTALLLCGCQSMGSSSLLPRSYGLPDQWEAESE